MSFSVTLPKFGVTDVNQLIYLQKTYRTTKEKVYQLGLLSRNVKELTFSELDKICSVTFFTIH